MVCILNFFSYYRSFMISALLCESGTERRRSSDFLGRSTIGADLYPGPLFYSSNVSSFWAGNPLGQGLPLNLVERVPLFL